MNASLASPSVLDFHNRFTELLGESERLGLKNDYDSRFGQFDKLFKAVFGDNGYPGVFSRILITELINEAQNIIGFYCDWSPLRRLMDAVAGQFERPGGLELYDDLLLTAVLDRAVEWHLYDNARSISRLLIPYTDEADTIADSEMRELRLKLGMRVAKILYLEAKCNPLRQNEREAETHLAKFQEYIRILGFNYDETMEKLKDSEENYSHAGLSFINLIDKKVKPKKTAGKVGAALQIYYNALNGILRPSAPSSVRVRVLPYFLQKIFEFQVPRISEAVKGGNADKALEYTLKILCCLGGVVPDKKTDAASLRREHLADGGKALMAGIRKSVSENIPAITTIHMKGQEHRRFLLEYMADLVENNYDFLAELDPDCGKLLEWAALHLAFTFMKNDCDRLQTAKESVDAARLYYFFYEKASGRLKDIRLNLFTETIARAADKDREVVIASLRWRISEDSYQDLFIGMRHNPEISLPEGTPDFVKNVRKGLDALKKQFDSETAKTGKGKTLHEAILDFLHYSADTLLKQSTSTTFDLNKLISDLKKNPKEFTLLLNEVRRIEKIFKFIQNSKNLPDDQFRSLALAAVDTLRDSRTKNNWALLGFAVNRHGSDETKKSVLNKLVNLEKGFSYPAFIVIAIHWLLNHKGSLNEAIAPETVHRYFSKSVASTFTVVSIFESLEAFGIRDAAKKKAVAEVLIKWVETVRDNYDYPEGKEIIYPYLGLLYAETGDIGNAELNRKLYLKTKPRNCKRIPAFHLLEERLTILPRFESDTDSARVLADHDTAPAKELIKALRHDFLYLLHSFDGQLNSQGAPLTARDLVAEYREGLIARLNDPKLHFGTGKLLYQYVFKDSFCEKHKSFGAARSKEEWNAAIARLRSILEINGNLENRIIPESYRGKLRISCPAKLGNIYRAYSPAIRSALGSIFAECLSRSEGLPEVEVAERGEMLRIEVISHNSKRTSDPTPEIRRNILSGIGGHARIAEALWGLCDFGLQYSTSEPAQVLGKVSKRTRDLQATDLVYIIHLPSIRTAGLTDSALAAAEVSDSGSDDLSMIL